MTKHAAICQSDTFWDACDWTTYDGTVITNSTERDAYYYCKYTTLAAYDTAKARNLSEPEVCEILGPWTTPHAAYNGSTAWGTSEIINLLFVTVGVARHAGKYPIGNEFRIEDSALCWNVRTLNTTVDGVAAYNTGTASSVFSILNTKINCGFKNCIAKGGLYGFDLGSISAGYGGFFAINCIAVNSYSSGFRFDGVPYFITILSNCVAYNCNTSNANYNGGFAVRISAQGGHSILINCISISNSYYDFYLYTYSANIQFKNCISSDLTANWTDCYTGKTAGEIFTDATNGDFSIPLSSFAKDIGVFITGVTPDKDIRNTYRNPAAIDIGAWEYDTGYTPPAEQTILTITANVSLVGAEVRIYDLDTSDGTFGTELSGTESHTSATYTYTGLRNNIIALQIMQTGYEEFLQTLTLENPTQSLSVALKADVNA